MKTIVLIGASSAIARSLATILEKEGKQIISLSRNTPGAPFSEYHPTQNLLNDPLPVYEGKVDGLVYFPGSIQLKPFRALKTADFVQDLEVNVLSAIRGIQHFLPNLSASSEASVVLVSSVAAATGLPFHASVSVSKGALESLVRALAAEFAGKIRFNAVAPSLTDTPLASKLLSSPEKIEAAQQRNPMKKVGTPEELANSIEFLLSTKSSWITGQVLAVDGGMSNIK